MKKFLFLSSALTVPPVHNNTIAEQRAAIETLTASIATVTSERDAARATAATLTAERDSVRADLASARTANATLVTERDAARAELASAQTSVTTLTADLATARAQATTVESKANRILASMGFSPLNLSESDIEGGGTAAGGDTPNALFAQYRGIKDAKARGKFYEDNKAKMFPSGKSK